MYFLHQMKKTKGIYDKGIVTKESLEDAKQSYHAYLGAYAYGKDADTTYAECMITEEDSNVILLREQWHRTENE